MKIQVLIVIILSFFYENSVLVHQDTPLRIDKNGNIIGLPKAFKPAKFDLESKYLRICDYEVILPECINLFFNEHKEPEVDLSASWYHSKEILPYYLDIEISQKGINFSNTILIDLESLELIHVRKFITKGNAVYGPEVELEKECLDEYKERIKAIK